VEATFLSKRSCAGAGRRELVRRFPRSSGGGLQRSGAAVRVRTAKWKAGRGCGNTIQGGVAVGVVGGVLTSLMVVGDQIGLWKAKKPIEPLENLLVGQPTGVWGVPVWTKNECRPCMGGGRLGQL